MKRNFKILIISVLTLFIVLSAHTGICAAGFINEVGEVPMLKLSSGNKITVDGIIDMQNEAWGKIDAVKITDTNSAPAWSQKSRVVSSQEVRFAYNNTSLYISAIIYDDSPVPSTSSDAESSSNEHGFNGDVFIFSIDPQKSILESSNPSCAAPWYCFTLNEDNSTGIYRSHAGNSSGTVTDISVFACAKKGTNCWTLEAALSWSAISNDLFAATGGQVSCTVPQMTFNNAVHNAKIIYMDRYAFRSDDMPDYTGMVDGTHNKGDIVTICRSFTPCNSIPGTSYPGTAGNPQQARTCGIYLTAVDHICEEGAWEEEIKGSCTVMGSEVKKCTVCQKVLGARITGYAHTPGEWQVTKEPSCITGSESVCCTSCGKTLETRQIQPLGSHQTGYPVTSYSVKENSLTGKKQLYCKICGESVKTNAVNIGYIFGDCENNSWYSDAVVKVYDSNLMSGTSEDTFKPNAAMTRSMMICVLGRINGIESTYVDTEIPFKDVEENKWYTPYIKWAYRTGLALGYSDSVFGVNDPITREQMAVFMYRYTHPDYTEKEAVLDKYTDKNEIHDFAKTAMSWAVDINLITGTSTTTLSPLRQATRAEAAMILSNYYTN